MSAVPQVRESRPGENHPEAATQLAKANPSLTARCRRCGRPVWALRSVQRQVGLVCWRHLHSAAVTA